MCVWCNFVSLSQYQRNSCTSCSCLVKSIWSLIILTNKEKVEYKMLELFILQEMKFFYHLQKSRDRYIQLQSISSVVWDFRTSRNLILNVWSEVHQTSNEHEMTIRRNYCWFSELCEMCWTCKIRHLNQQIIKCV